MRYLAQNEAPPFETISPALGFPRLVRSVSQCIRPLFDGGPSAFLVGNLPGYWYGFFSQNGRPEWRWCTRSRYGSWWQRKSSQRHGGVGLEWPQWRGVVAFAGLQPDY